MDKKQAKPRKGGAVWWVLQKMHDDLFSIAYRGPDKGKARDKAQAILSNDEKAQLLVGKVGRQMVLGSEHLQAQLPKDSF